MGSLHTYEELNFKFTTYLFYGAQNPCLRIGDVLPSLIFFVRLFVGRFGRACTANAPNSRLMVMGIFIFVKCCCLLI